MKKVSLKTVLITAAVFLCIAAGVFVLRLTEYPDMRTSSDIFRFICDGLFASGIFALGSGGLVFAANKGTFRGLTYCGSFIKNSLIPPFMYDKNKKDDFYNKEKRTESYSDYVKRKEEKPKLAFVHLLLTGASFLALSAVFFAIYGAL